MFASDGYLSSSVTKWAERKIEKRKKKPTTIDRTKHNQKWPYETQSNRESLNFSNSIVSENIRPHKTSMFSFKFSPHNNILNYTQIRIDTTSRGIRQFFVVRKKNLADLNQILLVKFDQQLSSINLYKPFTCDKHQLHSPNGVEIIALQAI